MENFSPLVNLNAQIEKNFDEIILDLSLIHI